MTIDDIYNLPVDKIADDDCVLFLWVTFPLLQEGLETIKRWGFQYKSLASIG
jgi:N6-adenosine-specific RNA methylase IME4